MNCVQTKNHQISELAVVMPANGSNPRPITAAEMVKLFT
jgi:hypothetical protein